MALANPDQSLLEEHNRLLARISQLESELTRPKIAPYPGGVFSFPGKSASKRQTACILECIEVCGPTCEHPRGCKSYEDVLTAGRWRALGYFIRKGQTAINRGGKHGTIPLFCRCQVESILPQQDANAEEEIPF